MSTPTTPRHCPDCQTELHHPKQLLCLPCWQKLPLALRQGFNHAIDIENRRAAYRAILNHIRHERENPPLFALPVKA